MSANSPPFSCPCCGHRTLAARRAWELCAVCFWEDHGDVGAHVVVGPNEVSLYRGQRNYLSLGAVQARFVGRVRSPLPGEERDPGWRSIGVMRDERAAPVLARLETVYADAVRPTEFTPATHCEECAEHDQWFRDHVDGLDLADIGAISAGGNPFCFLRPVGWAWLMPRLARFAFEPSGSWWAAKLVGFFLRGTFEKFQIQPPPYLEGHSDEQWAAVRALVMELAESVWSGELDPFDQEEVCETAEMWRTEGWGMT